MASEVESIPVDELRHPHSSSPVTPPHFSASSNGSSSFSHVPPENSLSVVPFLLEKGEESKDFVIHSNLRALKLGRSRTGSEEVGINSELEDPCNGGCCTAPFRSTLSNNLCDVSSELRGSTEAGSNNQIESGNLDTCRSIIRKANGSMRFVDNLEAVKSGIQELPNVGTKISSGLRSSKSGVERSENSVDEDTVVNTFTESSTIGQMVFENEDQSDGMQRCAFTGVSEDGVVLPTLDTKDTEIQVVSARSSVDYHVSVEPSTPKAEELSEDLPFGGWNTSSHCATASVSTSPLTASLTESHICAGFGRSKTAPSRPPKNSDDGMLCDSNHMFFRSKTERVADHRPTEGVRLLLSPAEKLSERKKKKIIENITTIQKDGTVEVHVDRSDEFAPNFFDLDRTDHEAGKVEVEDTEVKSIPPLSIAMLIVGTRGDVQPFVAIGKRLQENGHRVRLATHANFREFVVSSGLEFYPLGGDPKVLAGYMVKNKGFLPSGPYEISIQRKQLKDIMNSMLPACIEPDEDSGRFFKAEAIIANPPAYGHVHVAERLGVPLHIFFTMPWTPTNEFPHPLARVKHHAGYRLSYLVVDSLIWWGMRDLINEFRWKRLRLPPITYFNLDQGSISHLPTGYIWSPHLVPKPKDWGPRVDVVGFCFLDLAAKYRPPDALVEWLQAGEKPIYIGFGSIPVEDPGRMTNIIVQALEETGQRGIIDKGWGGLGNSFETPNFVYLLENCPHDWLFPQCAAVVHHGGAGTTAAGLKAGCPTTIVPFFGDQPFWGERVHARGVGPPPIPVHLFSLERLVNAIKFMLDPEVKQGALELAKQMMDEDGVAGAVDAFQKHWSKTTQLASSHEPLNFWHTIVYYLQKMSCLSCFT